MAKRKPASTKHERDCGTVLRAMRVLLGADHRLASRFDHHISSLGFTAPELVWAKATAFVQAAFGLVPVHAISPREAAALSVFTERDVITEHENALANHFDQEGKRLSALAANPVVRKKRKKRSTR